MLEACWPKTARTKLWTVPVGAATSALEATKILAWIGNLANHLDVECTTAYVNEHPADRILQAARSRGCDLIVLASNGRCGVLRLMLGSQAVRVLRHSVVPVLVYK